MWQTLRILTRTTAPARGRELRVAPTRATKDGTFLDNLAAAAGLLVRHGKAAPSPFDSSYKLTKLGEHAAEYGTFEGPLELVKLL